MPDFYREHEVVMLPGGVHAKDHCLLLETDCPQCGGKGYVETMERDYYVDRDGVRHDTGWRVAGSRMCDCAMEVWKDECERRRIEARKNRISGGGKSYE